MKELFVPYNMSLDLKELGFVDECLGQYITKGGKVLDLSEGSLYLLTNKNNKDNLYSVSAPTWEQLREWLIVNYNLYTEIRRNPHNEYIVFVEDYIWITHKSEMKKYNSYEQARSDAFEKAIDLIKNNNGK